MRYIYIGAVCGPYIPALPMASRTVPFPWLACQGLLQEHCPRTGLWSGRARSSTYTALSCPLSFARYLRHQSLYTTHCGISRFTPHTRHQSLYTTHSSASRQGVGSHRVMYRGTSLIRNSEPLGLP